MPASHFVGIISDTHGLLRAEATAALQGVELIIHAGDIDEPGILSRLRDIAPTVAVRGNVDRGLWAQAIPRTRIVELGPTRLFVIHNLEELSLDPEEQGWAAVIYGHSHRPEIRPARNVLYLNPGSAGPRRFNLPISLARLRVTGRQLQAELVDLPG